MGSTEFEPGMVSGVSSDLGTSSLRDIVGGADSEILIIV